MTEKNKLLILPEIKTISSEKKQTDLRAYLPVFTHEQSPEVYIENSCFDAKYFRYNKPYVMLGKAGFLVDYGYRLGYFAGTWQGQINRSLLYQDIDLMLQLAAKRTRQTDNFNDIQLGLWSKDWLIDGSDLALVEKLTKMKNNYQTLIRPAKTQNKYHIDHD